MMDILEHCLKVLTSLERCYFLYASTQMTSTNYEVRA
jgi:orotidine-5'-phosphate decarboxylase